MKTFYFTFRAVDQDHNKRSLKDCYTIVEAKNEEEATNEIAKFRGMSFCRMYKTAEDAGIARFKLRMVPLEETKLHFL